MEKDSNTVQKFSKSILDKVIVQIFYTGIITLGAGIVTFMISRRFSFSILEIVLFIVIVALLIWITSYILYRRMNRRTPVFDQMDCNFHMLKEERIHKWIDKDNYIHKRRYKLKALKNGLTFYTDKFQWTGTEYKLSGGNSDYSVEQEKYSRNVYDVYLFKFTTPLMKNQIIEVEATWNAKGPAKPFFSTTIEEPTDLLIMTIILYPNCGITKINREIESYKGSKVPIDSNRETLNSDGEYTWQVNSPKLLHHYEINWKQQA